MADPNLIDDLTEKTFDQETPNPKAFLKEISDPEIEEVSENIIRLIMELQLVDNDGNTLPNRAYTVRLDDTVAKSGFTDEFGEIQIDEKTSVKTRMVKVNIGKSDVAYRKRVREIGLFDINIKKLDMNIGKEELLSINLKLRQIFTDFICKCKKQQTDSYQQSIYDLKKSDQYKSIVESLQNMHSYSKNKAISYVETSLPLYSSSLLLYSP